MRPFLIAVLCVVACLVCAPSAQAGPLRNLGRAALHAAAAPLHAVGRVRANRKAARQARRSARGC